VLELLLTLTDPPYHWLRTGPVHSPDYCSHMSTEPCRRAALRTWANGRTNEELGKRRHHHADKLASYDRPARPVRAVAGNRAAAGLCRV